MLRNMILGIAASVALVAGSTTALAQGTAITYQGQLKVSGAPVNSATDMQFSLWTTASGGTQVGTTITSLNVSVTNGLFTTPIDFGVNPYTSSQNLFLQIAVRNPAGGGAYVPMGSRQLLTPSPFSLATRGINVDGAGNVGIGVSAPSGTLDVFGSGTGPGTGPARAIRARSNSAFGVVIQADATNLAGGKAWDFFSTGGGASEGQGRLIFRNNTDSLNALTIEPNGNTTISGNLFTGGAVSGNSFQARGPQSTHSQGAHLQWNKTGGDGASWLLNQRGVGLGGIIFGEVSTANTVTERMRIDGSGNVGIGLNTPTERLDVAGNVKIRTNDRLYFGQPGEETDTFFLSRFRFAADESVLELGLGDNPSAVGNDAFIITTRDAGGGGARNTVFQFNTSGIAQKPGGGSWANLSDERSKNDIEPMTGTLDRLLQLKGHSYSYKPEYVQNGRALSGIQIGLVAQEVETVFPDWVTTGPDGLKVVTERSTTALMVEAMRDLRNEKDAEIARVKSDNAELKARLEKIEAMLAAQASQTAK